MVCHVDMLEVQYCVNLCSLEITKLLLHIHVTCSSVVLKRQKFEIVPSRPFVPLGIQTTFQNFFLKNIDTSIGATNPRFSISTNHQSLINLYKKLCRAH